MRAFLVGFILSTLLSTANAGPKVMASIVPIHSIVAAVMGDRGIPDLIYKGTVSEHSASLTPQQIASLGAADLVFMTGSSIEVRLGQINGQEAVNGKVFAMLAEAPGVTRLKIREGGAWEAHEHEDEQGHGAEEDEQQEGVASYNAHVWLSPANAKAMAEEVSRRLQAVDPANAATYRANARAFAAAVDIAAAEVAAMLEPVKDRPFIVFHDAYPYFEQAFGLSAVGSISDSSGTAPSAKRIGEIQAKIVETNAVCVFREPQFDARFAETVVEGSAARLGVLDAVGATLAPGPDAYLELIRKLGRDAASCLSGRS